MCYFIDKSSTQAQQQKRSKSTKNYNNVEHHVKGILNSFVMKSQQKDKQQVNITYKFRNSKITHNLFLFLQIR